MATSEKSGLSCAKSTQRVKLEEATRWVIDHIGYGVMTRRAGQAFTWPARGDLYLLGDLKDAGDVGFRFAEGLARAHYVGFACYENAPLVAFVPHWGSLADVRAWRP